MQVLFVIPYLGNGGAERVIVNVANGLAAMQQEVGIFTFQSGGEYEVELDERVRLFSCNSRVKTVPEVMRATAQLVRVASRYEVIVSGLELFTEKLVMNAKAVFAVARQCKRYVALVHIALSSYQRFTAKAVHRRRVKSLYPHFDAVIAVSHGARNDLVNIIGRPLETIHVVYNPVCTETITARAEEVIDVQGMAPYFLNVGRLSAQKDQATLLQAYAHFCTRHGSTHHLLILGRGECEPALQAQCRELGLTNVHFLGFQQNPWAYMRHAAALVSTSIFEGFPLVLTEAAALGVPIIATDCPSGPAEILKNGADGYLVAMRDAPAAAAAMEQVILHPEEALAKAQRAQQFACTLDIGIITRRYLEICSGDPVC